MSINEPRGPEASATSLLDDEVVAGQLARVRKIGFARTERKVAWPDFVHGIVCKWDMEHDTEHDRARKSEQTKQEPSPRALEPNRITVSLWHDGRNIGTMALGLYYGTRTPTWELHHRYIAPEKRNKKLGTLLLRAIEEYAKRLKTVDSSLPSIIETSTSMPSLVQFMRPHGYAFMLPEERNAFERFEREKAENQNNPEFKAYGTLPSFQLITLAYPDGLERDGGLIDRRKLEKYELFSRTLIDKGAPPYVGVLEWQPRPKGAGMALPILRTDSMQIRNLPFVVMSHLWKRI